MATNRKHEKTNATMGSGRCVKHLNVHYVYHIVLLLLPACLQPGLVREHLMPIITSYERHHVGESSLALRRTPCTLLYCAVLATVKV